MKNDAFVDAVRLVARALMMLLFVISGWQKLMNFPDTVAYLAQTGAPLPPVSAVVAIVMELFVPILIAIGLFLRPLAALLALYTLATAFIGHHYWTMTGAVRSDNMIHFYKNVSIVGGLLLLSVVDVGSYALDRRVRMAGRRTG